MFGKNKKKNENVIDESKLNEDNEDKVIEGLDEDTISRSINAIMTCDTLIIIDTSLRVYPAAGFIRYFRGKYLVVINKDSTAYDSNCDLVFNEDVINVIKNIWSGRNTVASTIVCG